MIVHVSIYHSVKDITGYDPKDLMADSVLMNDFIHPADQIMMKRIPEVEFCKYVHVYCMLV